MTSTLSAILVLAGAQILIALACLIMGYRARAGTLERNRWFGMRLSALMHSDTAWKAGHAAIAPALIGLGWFGIPATLGIPALALVAPQDFTVTAGVTLLLLETVVLVMWAWRAEAVARRTR